MADLDPASRQLLLNFPAYPEFTFDNFVVSEGSRFAVTLAREFVSHAPEDACSLFLSGPSGLGKTHLLLAMGNLASQTGVTALFMQSAPFCKSMESENDPEVTDALSRLQKVDLLLLDDVDQLKGHPKAQEKLYYLYNAFKETGQRMAFAGSTQTESLWEPYLQTRFKWGLTAQLSPLDEPATKELLHRLADELGLTLNESSMEFLITRLERDYPSLKTALEKINQESLLQKKKITPSLIRSALQLEGG